ncbi:MAG TPA: HD domain-containing protein [Candidatus Lokiarchaeia archaeon]|nr:HD domain-containing protein [Candidatus Lokiarchaeia archaeon]
MSDYIALLEAIHAVKHLPRKGWIEHGLDEQQVESVAAHSFGTAALACILKEGGYFPDDLPFERVMELALLHDIGESVIGDVTPADDVPAEKKAAMEREAVRTLLHDVPGLDAMTKDLEGLVSAHGETGTDRVHALVKQLDKLDMMIQALFYERDTGKDLSEFYNDPRRYLADETLLAFFESVKQGLG